MANAHPVARLEEGLEAMRLLFATPDEVDFDGEHITLRGVALGLRPFGDGTAADLGRRARPPRPRARGASWRRVAAAVPRRRRLRGDVGRRAGRSPGPPAGRPTR